jgi:hypothetical protein
MRWLQLTLAGLLIAYGTWPAAPVCDDANEPPEAPEDTDPCAMQCTAPSIDEAEQQGNSGNAALGAFELMIPVISGLAIGLNPAIALFSGYAASGIIDGVKRLKDTERDSESNYWNLNHLEKYISDNTEYELCRIKQLLGDYLAPVSEYIHAEAMTKFNEQLLGSVMRWNLTKSIRVCANYSDLAGDERPISCYRDFLLSPQESTECNATNAQMEDIERGATVCSLPQADAVSSCDTTLRRGVCGRDRRCYNVRGIVDVGVDACETLEYMNGRVDYGNAMDRYAQVDALALYSRYVLFEIAILNTQILSGVGGGLALEIMRVRASTHEAWLLRRVDALRSFAVEKGLDVILSSSTIALPEASAAEVEWKYSNSMLSYWWKGWQQCGVPNGAAATPLEERRYMHSVQIGCPGKIPVKGLEGEERYRLVGVNANAKDLEWCQGFRNCSVENLLANTTSRTCMVKGYNGQPRSPSGYPPRAIGSHTGAVTEEQVNVSSCAFRMPLEDGAENLCADVFPETVCVEYKARCSDALERVWNRTVEGAHQHLQYLVFNLTEPYFLIANLLHELVRSTDTKNGTDNLTGSARVERIWPMPTDVDYLLSQPK